MINANFIKKSILIPIIPGFIAAIIYGVFFNEDSTSFTSSDISNTVNKNTQTVILNIGGNQEKVILEKKKDNFVSKPVNFVKPLIDKSKINDISNDSDLADVDISNRKVKEEKDKKPLRQIISKESAIKTKPGNKKTVRLTIDDIHVEHNYPCSGKVGQISGVLMNHVRVSPSTNSPSQMPAEGGSQIKIENSIYRDSKGWFKIMYDSGNRSHSGWIPSNYIIPYSDCKNN